MILALGFSSVALAQGLPAFEEVDANADGLIDSSEASAVEGLDIAAADANQDGTLDREEYSAVAGE
jgi:hypothetical protein